MRESIAEPGVELLKSKFDVVEDGTSDLASIIGDFDGIVIRSATTLDAPMIERAERLKVIGRAGVGIDNVDVDAATRRGIVVANAPESTVVSAAEHTVALMLALARNVPQAHAALKAGSWERPKFAGIELAGKTLGVLGLGRIGREVARRALALGMRVIAYDPFVSLDRFRELGVESATPGGGLRGGRRDHAPPAAERRDARAPRRRGLRRDARRRAHPERGPRRADRRGCAHRRRPLREGRGRRDRRVRARSRTLGRCSSSTRSW